MAQFGYRQAPGQPNRMISPTGDIVTRASYRNVVSQAYGYSSEHARRGRVSQDTNYVNAFLNTEQGQRVLEANREMGRSPRELEQWLIAARNGRPHPNTGNPGSPAYHQFMEDYDFEDYGIELDIDSP